MELAFWFCLGMIAYPYAIYPLLLILLTRGSAVAVPSGNFEPTVTIVLPVHNEARRLAARIHNLLQLDYPQSKVQILVVGDGCTDDSIQVASEAGAGRVSAWPLPARGGKAAALNAALERATGEIIVFTDAAIRLEPGSLRRLVAHFADPRVGCVSGEDYIEGGGSEGLYGRLELLLRRQEAALHSIAGASGCYYAQRRALCRPFIPGMAPDFLSVLVTVRAGSRALAEPGARGAMTATKSQAAEFSRKSRTFLRGMTALFGNSQLLNPFRHPAFAFILWSHKLLRWLAPLFMLGALVLSLALWEQQPYRAFAILQVLAYGVAGLGIAYPAFSARFGLVRLCAFFVLVNAAALLALGRWVTGERVEVWEPTVRPG